MKVGFLLSFAKLITYICILLMITVIVAFITLFGKTIIVCRFSRNFNIASKVNVSLS